MTDDDALIARVTSYLSTGGLFNPELAQHDAVRDLLIDLRDRIAALTAENERLHKTERECWTNPEAWMQWCDHRVADRATKAEAERDALRQAVPREPTAAMLEAGRAAYAKEDYTSNAIIEAWCAMYDAAALAAQEKP